MAMSLPEPSLIEVRPGLVKSSPPGRRLNAGKQIVDVGHDERIVAIAHIDADGARCSRV